MGLERTIRHLAPWGITCVLLPACSSDRAQQELQRTGRAVQPTVSAFECGGESARQAIAACRAEGGKYGRCALVAWHAGVTDATACYGYSSKVHERREQLVGQEDQLDAQINYLKDVNADTRQLNVELAGKVETATERTDVAVESLQRAEMTQSELAQLRAILDTESSYADRQLRTALRELQAAERYRSQQKASTAALDAEIARLKALVDETQRQTQALAAQRGRI